MRGGLVGKKTSDAENGPFCVFVRKWKKQIEGRFMYCFGRIADSTGWSSNREEVGGFFRRSQELGYGLEVAFKVAFKEKALGNRSKAMRSSFRRCLNTLVNLASI